MMPTFAGWTWTVRKAARLTLELVKKFGPNVKAFFFLSTNIIPRNTPTGRHQWGGIWTDLSIEQTLMRYSKSVGGLPGRRLRNQTNHQG